MKKPICLLLFVILSNLSFSQTGNLKGIIIDYYDEEPVYSADIYCILNGDTIKQVSNFSGEFCYNELEFGKYNIRVSKNYYFNYDTIINFSEDTHNLRLTIRSSPSPIKNKKTDVEFEYRHVPTNSEMYKYTITKQGIFLYQQAIIFPEKSSPDYGAERADTSTYFHVFSEFEKAKVDSIIIANKLDSVALYETRITHPRKCWKVKIVRNNITFEIDLPNYHNQGLEDLLNYVSSLIPEDKKHYWSQELY